MTEIQLQNHPGVTLVSARVEMAEEIYTVVDQDREHIGQFLPFVDQTEVVQDTLNYLESQLKISEPGKELIFTIQKAGQIIGMIELHHYSAMDRRAELGYWLTKAYTKQGIMTAAAKALCDYAFQVVGLHQIIVLADVENPGSNGVIRSAGFTYLTTYPDYSYRAGAYHDMNVYYRLANE